MVQLYCSDNQFYLQYLKTLHVSYLGLQQTCGMEKRTVARNILQVGGEARYSIGSRMFELWGRSEQTISNLGLPNGFTFVKSAWTLEINCPVLLRGDERQP